MESKITTIEEVENLLTSLTADEKQLLKDTINKGAWGDTDMSFMGQSGESRLAYAYGYCTNDAQKAGNFKGRIVSQMFRSIYRKLCPNKGIGLFLTQINDWWEDGSGDMLFISTGYYKAFEAWARGTILTPEQVSTMATQFYAHFCNGKETESDCKACKMFRKECTHSIHRHQS